MKKEHILLLLLPLILFSCQAKRPPSSPQDSLSAQNTPSSEVSSSPAQSVQTGSSGASNAGVLPGYSGYWTQNRLVNIMELIEFYPDQLPYIRNEIFARYGRPFVNQVYKDYFNAKSWYHERSDFSESWLSKTDSDNADFISSVEREAQTSIDAITGQVLRNIEYTDGRIALTFTSRYELILSDTEVEFGPYALGEEAGQTISWTVVGGWILVYKAAFWGDDYDAAAYKLDHASKRIIGSGLTGTVNKRVMEGLLRAQGRPIER
jgi:hypothetical protein